MERKLNSRQKRFLKEYISGSVSASEAYRRAGYKRKNARSGAYKLLQNPTLRGYIYQQDCILQLEIINLIRKIIDQAKNCLKSKDTSLCDITNFGKFLFKLIKD